MKKEPSKEEYQQIVKNLTPKHNSLLNCTKAFVTGGTFCVLGEVMKQLMMKYLNLSKKDSLLYVTIELILLRDRKSTRLNSSHPNPSRMPSSA